MTLINFNVKYITSQGKAGVFFLVKFQFTRFSLLVLVLEKNK